MRTSGKSLLKQNIQAIHDDLILGHKRSKNYPSAVIGTEREIIIEKLLSVILPSVNRYGCGIIIDHEGKSTGQVDLLIESPLSTSLPISNNRQRLYFADSVVAAFEIKSDLSKQKSEAFEKIDQIMSLKTKKVKLGAPKGEEEVVRISDYQIPSFIVSFKGAVQPTVDKWIFESQERRLRKPTGVLCIELGYFWGMTPQGEVISSNSELAIYGFICCLNSWINNRATASVNDNLYIDLLNDIE